MRRTLSLLLLAISTGCQPADSTVSIPNLAQTTETTPNVPVDRLPSDEEALKRLLVEAGDRFASGNADRQGVEKFLNGRLKAGDRMGGWVASYRLKFGVNEAGHAEPYLVHPVILLTFPARIGKKIDGRPYDVVIEARPIEDADGLTWPDLKPGERVRFSATALPDAGIRWHVFKSDDDTLLIGPVRMTSIKKIAGPGGESLSAP